MTNQIDINKFNTMISQASDAILCNSECQQQRKSEQLKQQYINANANLNSASDQVQVAQKNYVTFTQGEQGYNQLREQQLNEEAQLIVDQFNENFNEEVVKINIAIDSYNGLLINYKNVLDLFRTYLKENVKLTKDVTNETNDVLTNERKTYYENQNIDKLKYYYHYFILSIYIFFVIGFGWFSLIYPSKYSRTTLIVIFIVFIGLPFLSTWILGSILYLLYSIYNMLPKNVYSKKNF